MSAGPEAKKWSLGEEEDRRPQSSTGAEPSRNQGDASSQEGSRGRIRALLMVTASLVALMP